MYRNLLIGTLLVISASGCTAEDLALLAAGKVPVTSPAGASRPVPSPGATGAPRSVASPAASPMGSPAPTTPSRSDTEEALARLNATRKLAGLGPVVLDEALSSACRKHVEYLRLNIGTPAVVGLEAHKERPDLPGATPEGAEAGEQSDIGYVPLVASVDAWVNSLYHRTPILEPRLTKVGMAAVSQGDTHFSMLLFGDRPPAPDDAYPIRFPADGQTDVPRGFEAGEEPDPVPGGQAAVSGSPITLHFKPWTKVTGVSATLVDAAGNAVPFHLSDPEHPATFFEQGFTVCVIPKQPLKPAETYHVSVNANAEGQSAHAWDWRFTVAPAREVAVADATAMTGAVGQVAWYSGEVAYSGFQAERVYLQLRMGEADHVTVWIPSAVWDELSKAGVGSYEALVGRRVRVLGRSSRYQGAIHIIPTTAADVTVL